MQTVGLLTVSVPEVLTVTSLVYQPFAPGVPAVTASAAVGGVLSSTATVILGTESTL